MESETPTIRPPTVEQVGQEIVMQVTQKLVTRLACERTLNPDFERAWVRTRNGAVNPVAVLLALEHKRRRNLEVAAAGLLLGLLLPLSAYALLGDTLFDTSPWSVVRFLTIASCAVLGFVAALLGAVSAAEGSLHRSSIEGFISALQTLVDAVERMSLEWSLSGVEILLEENGQITKMAASKHLVKIAAAKLKIERSPNVSGRSYEAAALDTQLKKYGQIFVTIGMAKPNSLGAIYRAAENELPPAIEPGTA